MTSGRQLYPGQLRYHDFTLLREANLLRQRRNNGIFNLQKKINIETSNFRTFFTASMRQNIADLKLKTLERAANNDPLNLNLQFEFLHDLSEQYPESVVERFETNRNFAVDERCALLYLESLQRIGKWQEFDLNGFSDRLNQPGSRVDPLKIEIINEMVHDKNLNLNRKQLATETMRAMRRSEVGASVGSTSFLTLGGTKGMSYGSDPKFPLHLLAQSKNFSLREQVAKFGLSCLGLFFVISVIGAILDERGVSRAFGMSGKHIQESEGSNVRFGDVKGVEEAKAELEEIVQYLKNPAKFTRLGGKLPRGLLLLGPPGTGKTLLAKAIAGEANVPFFFSSGSQFEEVYVGLGAKRIRELFEAAKKKSPAIIFIDEIDAVGGSRRLKDQSALKMTLNELLVQLDGFEENSGIIVIGATNFPEALDKALLRPGRFDKHVVVPLPDIGGRKEILDMYAKKTKLSPDVDLDVLARGTIGFSGADLYNLMNQAALKASVDGLNFITMSVLEYAKDKIMMGSERKSAVISSNSAKKTAYHEAGHAVVAFFTEGAMPIHKATIMPRGQALGMVTMLAEGDQTSQSFKQLLAQMDVCMGGRIAEELIFGTENATSGAMSDLQQATQIARSMITKCGYSDKVGFVNQSKPRGKTLDVIDFEIKRLTDLSYKRAKDLLLKYSKEHKLLAETLLEYETLTGEEVKDLLTKGTKPQRPIVNTRNGARGNPKVALK